jgi:hypothetical protein
VKAELGESQPGLLFTFAFILPELSAKKFPDQTSIYTFSTPVNKPCIKHNLGHNHVRQHDP